MSADVLTPNVEVAAEAPRGSGFGRKAWAWGWPKLLAIGLVLAFWQVVYVSGWRPAYVLPSPAASPRTPASCSWTSRSARSTR